MEIGQKLVIKKNKLDTWVERLMKIGDVVAPVKENDEFFFKPIQDIKNYTMNHEIPYIPPKDLIFPQSENLFEYSRDSKGIQIKPLFAGKKQIVLGIRSCDVEAAAYVDHFFRDTFEDPYYFNRRKNTIFISLGCNKAFENCFCICCDAGPFDPKGYDLQMIDLGDQYLTEIGSREGAEVISKDQDLFSVAKDEDLKKAEEIKKKARDTFKEPIAYMSYAIRKITTDRVPKEIWDELGERCVDCGGCTFVCPLCTCFTVEDIATNQNGGRRFRCWDSCNYSGFTREVSGHNPRGDKGERFKRRFFHKLSYQYIEKYLRHQCVGCGRCITACPAGVDMPSVVKRLRG